MPIRQFYGDTFVAFIDISGFKYLMKKRLAQKALKKLYNYGYHFIRENNPPIEGFFISDSGILFIRTSTPNSEPSSNNLHSLLKVIKQLNVEMLKEKVLLTTSIVYDEFIYTNMDDYDGILKNPVYGKAYLKAYMDTVKENPKLKPGECRILKRKVPNHIEQDILDNSDSFEFFKLLENTRKDYYYFYWMLDNQDNIETFKTDYVKAYNSRYKEIKKLLKVNIGNQTNLWSIN